MIGHSAMEISSNLKQWKIALIRPASLFLWPLIILKHLAAWPRALRPFPNGLLLVKRILVCSLIVLLMPFCSLPKDIRSWLCGIWASIHLVWGSWTCSRLSGKEFCSGCVGYLFQPGGYAFCLVSIVIWKLNLPFFSQKSATFISWFVWHMHRDAQEAFRNSFYKDSGSVHQQSSTEWRLYTSAA